MIKPASETTLTQGNIQVPNVADVVSGWLSPMSAKRIVKTIIDGDVGEIAEVISFNGMIQPLSGFELQIKPEGERAWEWVKVYTDKDDLKVDDVININGDDFRINIKMPYEKYKYGFHRYEAVRDFK